jgi:parallel beta-helix repeat protein
VSGNSSYGACWSTLYNCTVSGNWDCGAYWGTLYNCTLSGNSADYGGGAFGSALYNCTLSGNWANYGGGGAYGCILYNCIVYYNTAPVGANYYFLSSLNYCCTRPIPTNGVGNISTGPLFVDSANGNLRLQSNSPCINAGNNAYVSGTTDLDGRPRIVGGTVDIGAYEFQPGVSGAFIGWLQQYGLPTDGSADYADPDRDGMNNWQEWVCGTNPTNRLSVLRLLSPSITSTNVTVSWQSVAGVNYFLERSANPAAPFTLLATNILGQAGMTSCGDTNAAGKGPFFYRVGIRSP